MIKSSLSETKKKLLVECIQRGLALHRMNVETSGLIERNALGLWALNYIFGEARKLDSDFEIFAFKRGPFSTVFLYDAETESIINFISKQNLKRLDNRGVVDKTHYADALVLYNKKIYDEPQQLCIFEEESKSDQRQIIQQQIEFAIMEKKPKQHLFVVYDIDHKGFQLRGVFGAARSEHYYPIFDENWSKYILIDIDDLNGVDSSNAPYNNFGTESKKARLGIKIKREFDITHKDK